MNTEIFDLGKIGITLGGEYDNKVVYEKLTIVLYKGKSYISTKITHGVSPEQNIETWQLVAEAKDAYDMLVAEGKTTLTREEFLEQLVDATKGRYVIQGNLVNAADEEDLTVEHSSLLGIDTLKLANRPSTNGMGYVILRKNKSFAEQITKENTVYEIRYDFTLTEDITIPANCVLKFDGGSISASENNTITCNNTIINAGPVKIFDKSITLSGTLKNDEGHIRWFGSDPDKQDNTEEIQKVIDSFDIVYIDQFIYKISGINITKAHALIGLAERFIGDSGFICNAENATLVTIIKNPGNPYILFKNISFLGVKTSDSYQPGTVGIDASNKYAAQAMSIRVINCVFENLEIAINSYYNSYYNLIEKCRFNTIKWILFRFHANNLNFQNNDCRFFDIAIYKTIGDGPLNIRNSSFEWFTDCVFDNDYYKSTFNLNFEGNYIEGHIFNTILRGWAGNITSCQNLIQIVNDSGRNGSIDCIYNPKDCESLISINNTINLRSISINGYIKSTYTSEYRTYKLIVLKDIYNDGGNVDISNYDNYNMANLCTSKAILEGYDFLSNRIYSHTINDIIIPVKANGYNISETDRRYATWIVNNNILYLYGTLKKNDVSISEGQTHIADITADLTTMYLTHNSTPNYPAKDDVYIKAMDSSFEPIILLLHINTGIIDFIKGDTTKDIIFDGCCVNIII